MTPIAWALLGVVGGFAIGAIVMWWTLRPRAAAAAAAHLAQTRLQSVIDSLRAVVVIVNPDGTVAASSRLARTSGLVRSTQLQSDEVTRLAAEISGTTRTASLEVSLPRTQRSPAITLDLELTSLPDHSVLVAGEDRSAYERFTETRRDFVANVTHELKTPIGAILLLAEAIETASDDAEAVSEFAGRMSTEAVRLNDLVSDILALSRLQATEPLLLADRVSVDEVIEASVQRSRAQAAARQVSVTVGGEQGLWVLGDARQLETAVSNLIENAIAYSEADARVTVTSRAAGDAIEIKITDNGIGIGPADLERIFERFYRVDAGRSRASGGTGLGLSIVKHVAAAHGGDVTAWSRLGQGSTFTLRLPLERGLP
ncbi:MAG: ATP-binding protein [Propionicimonas sp.]|jgi:two-component system sensor histidine kinase SenX3